MPVELCVDSAGPLDDRVAPNRIVERGHEDIGAGRAGGTNRRVHVGHQVSSPLRAEWVGYRCLESENGHGPDWREHQLRHRTARSGRHSEDALLRGGAAKRGQEAGDEAVEILR